MVLTAALSRRTSTGVVLGPEDRNYVDLNSQYKNKENDNLVSSYIGLTTNERYIDIIKHKQKRKKLAIFPCFKMCRFNFLYNYNIGKSSLFIFL